MTFRQHRSFDDLLINGEIQQALQWIARALEAVTDIRVRQLVKELEIAILDQGSGWESIVEEELAGK